MNSIGIANASRRQARWPLGIPVYIARPHPLGNPYIIRRDGDRDTVIAKYEQWFITSVLRGQDPQAVHAFANLRKVLAIDDLVLLCWCHPAACHADVIRKYLLKAW